LKGLVGVIGMPLHGTRRRPPISQQNQFQRSVRLGFQYNSPGLKCNDFAFLSTPFYLPSSWRET